MTERHRLRVVTVLGAVLLAVPVLGACSDSKGASNTTVAATESTVAATGGAGGDDAATSDTAPAHAVLGDALAALGSNYHFVTTVRVDGKAVMTAEGDRVGAGARLELTTETGVVSYVVTAAGSWAKPENGNWAELDVPAAATDPMAALVDATSITLGPSADGVQQLEVEVSNEALGIPGGGTATVTVQVQNSLISQISYTSSVSGKAAEVTTVFGAVRDASEVVAPV